MNRGRALLALVGAAITFGSSASAQHTVSPAKPGLRQLAQRIVDAGAPGALVAVRDSNGTRVGAAGFADLRTREKLRPADAFRVGSITKGFVSTVVLQLAGEGVLSLDDPVEKWLPGLVPHGGSITLRMLLNHTSGIYNYTDDKRFQAVYWKDHLHVYTPEELVAIAVAHLPLFAPGKDWSYSNTGYILLGLVVEQATGTTLERQLRTRIFEPLGLTRTSLPSLPTLPAPFAHGYLLPGNVFIPVKPKRRVDVTVESPSGIWAAGALVSNAGDLARFYAALLGGRLLRPDLLRQMTRTVVAEWQPRLRARPGQVPDRLRRRLGPRRRHPRLQHLRAQHPGRIAAGHRPHQCVDQSDESGARESRGRPRVCVLPVTQTPDAPAFANTP